MSETKAPQGFLSTNQPDLFFEDNTVGRMKKEVWEASDEQINAILADYGIPSPVEWAKPGSYIQTTTRWQVEENCGNSTRTLIGISFSFRLAAPNFMGSICPVQLIPFM